MEEISKPNIILDPIKIIDITESAHVVGTVAIGPEVVIEEIPNSEKFTEFPNRQSSLRAKDDNHKTVYAMHEIAKKLYRCPCCTDLIEIGSEHTVKRTIQADKKYQHHHLHSGCFTNEVIDTLKDIKIVEASFTARKNLDKRRKKHMKRKSS